MTIPIIPTSISKSQERALRNPTVPVSKQTAYALVRRGLATVDEQRTVDPMGPTRRTLKLTEAGEEWLAEKDAAAKFKKLHDAIEAEVAERVYGYCQWSSVYASRWNKPDSDALDFVCNLYLRGQEECFEATIEIESIDDLEDTDKIAAKVAEDLKNEIGGYMHRRATGQGKE